MLIGRDKEKQLLLNALSEEYSQFVVVYGRRRVGKTFLIREAYGYRFDFQFTGAAKLTARKQLVRILVVDNNIVQIRAQSHPPVLDSSSL